MRLLLGLALMLPASVWFIYIIIRDAIKKDYFNLWILVAIMFGIGFNLIIWNMPLNLFLELPK